MTIPLLALAVLGFLLVAWGMEFRHKEEILPTLRPGRHIPPVALVLVATLVAIPIVIAPLASLAEWPRSTQVAWTGAEAADRDTGLLAIGGPEHSAILGWPNGNFWPEVEIAPGTAGKMKLRTRGGTAIVRAGDDYANGELVELGKGAKQIGRFTVEYKRRFFFWKKLIIARTAAGEPLATLNPPPTHGTRLRVLDSLLVPRLNDLRREGRIDLATVQALEEWARTIRLLHPEKGKLRLVTDGETWRELDVADGATVEILWPRRRLGMRIAENGGAPRVTFEAPWMRTTSLPPFEESRSSLSFAREPAIGENTFLLPLGHGAPEFRHEEALQISTSGLPRFRDGVDLLPQSTPDGPSFARRTASARATLNRSLSAVRVPLVVPNAAERGLILTVTMVRDLPTPRALFVALFLAWLALAVFVASIAFGSTQLRLRDLWAIGGVLVAVWTLLLFRVLLAVRYLVAPSAVDEVTVKGLAGSLAALVIIPGLIALAARLWLHHREETDARNRLITVGVAITFAVITLIEFTVMPRQVLPNVAARFTSSPFDKLLLVVYVIATAAVARASAPLWQLAYRVTFQFGRDFWRALGDAARATPAAGMRRSTEAVRHVWTALQSPAIKPVFTIWGLGSIAILVLSRLAPEYIRQIVAPFWILGLPALILLARPLTGAEDALRVLDGEAQPMTETPLPDTIATVVLLAFVPVAVMFAVLGDFGAIYAVLAFWLPLGLLLLLTPATRMAATLLITIVLGVAIAKWALLGTYRVAPGMTEHILSRVEVMKHGASAQEWLLDLEAPSAGDAKSVTASNVRNALVHEWEHMALVRKGGWTGLGYNHAPASQSYIRQDTIQYDSVYSFFISGEHGILGGLLLMLLFAAPAIVLLLRRSSLHIGDILALAIAAALVGEAVVHAAMNVAQLWFSGRNLPLLATSSNSDILRWGLLLGLMTQALLWNQSAVTRRSVFDPAFAYGARRRWKWLTATAIIGVGLFAAAATKDFAWLAFAALIPLAMAWRTREFAALALMPALFVTVLVLRGSVRAVRSDEYDILTWSRLLKRVDELYDAGRLRFDPKTKRILFRAEDGQLTDRPTGSTLLEAEVLRFNAMPASLRMDGGRASLPAAFFAGAATPQDYYNRMYLLWQAHTENEQRVRPSVFTIDRAESEDGVAYEVRGNPDFNVVHSFAEELRQEDLQPIAIRGAKGPVPVLGHAWVMGRWVYAPSADARRLGLGWLREAGDALFRISEVRRQRAAQLTIDAELQQAVQSTVEGAGRDLFGNLLASRAASALPPRVALTIMNARSGEVLAMGAWPRAASGDRWRSRNVSDGEQSWRELEPPLSWLGTSAPRALASRQAVDHNFSAIEMGSAAKPFWATAALTVHPTLDRSLFIRNGDCDYVLQQGANQRCYEQQMFGAKIANKGWQVSPVARWMDFSTYLAASDNRYHTRLGLLGLAKSSDGKIASDGRGTMRSGRESLTASRTPWDRYPALADATGNTREHPNRLTNLHQQPLAHAMRDLFGANTGAPSSDGETRRYLLSFWSGDQRDDLRTSEGLEPLSVVSPEAVDLRLSGVRDTREYIAILLGGASSRWSNVAAASAFSTWAMRKPVVPHIVERKDAAVALPSRKFDERATEAATKLNTGLRRVIQDGTALPIKRQTAYLEESYDFYAKTGTLVTIDPNRPTSRILIIIVARDGDGNVRNAITLSFVAERSSSGFATALAGQFIARHEAELIRLLESR